MTSGVSRQSTSEHAAQEEQQPLFFDGGHRSPLQRWVALAVAAVVIIGAIWLAEGSTSSLNAVESGAAVTYDFAGQPVSASVDSGEGPRIGKPAPDFTLMDIQDTAWQLNGLRGKAVLVNFWATWCPPCRAEMPELDAIHQKYKDDGVVVLGINLREDRAQVGRFARLLNLSFPILLDPQAKAIAQYNVVALPTTVFVNREGVITDINIGALSDKALEAKLQKARQ